MMNWFFWKDSLHYYEVNTNKRMTFWPCITVPKMTFNIVHYSDKRMLIFLICKFMWFRLLLCHLLCTKRFFVSLSALWQKNTFFWAHFEWQKAPISVEKSTWLSFKLVDSVFVVKSTNWDTLLSVLVLSFLSDDL